MDLFLVMVIKSIRLGNDLGNRNIYTEHIFEIFKSKINEEGEGVVVAYSIIDGKIFSFKSQHIIEIDGMNMKRLSQVYGLKENGESTKVHKKRGRKTKVEKALLEAQKNS